MLSPLSAIDAAVKAHEWSHLLTLGPYAAGPIQYDFIIDSEGNRYAVGGSVAVDLSPVPGDPEATARKAKAVLQAAYAPGNPSGADLQVAQKAHILLREAEEELKSEASAESMSNQLEPSDSKTNRTTNSTFISRTDRNNRVGIETEEPIDRNTSLIEKSSLYGTDGHPASFTGYTPGGEKSPWYDFWFEREDSQNRGLLFSFLV